MSRPHSSRAHALVRAAAWSDGGAEFIYSDGTVLSFVDDMNSFVAVRANATTGSGDDGSDREMCFTAWTLSAYEADVRAALAVYNSLAERPRLFSTLLPSQSPSVVCGGGARWQSSSAARFGQLRSTSGPASSHMADGCGVWREPGPPIDTLLLEKRSDLFTRHTVYGTVREWLVAPSGAATTTAAATALGDEGDTTAFSIHDLPLQENLDHATTAASSSGTHTPSPPHHHPDALPDCVPVGTVLELWCALRRVCLTVAPHRATFTVRWPAPVTRPDGSRLPPSVAPWVSTSHEATAAAAAVPVLFTYVEQTFPVCAPPAAWQVMLDFALDLDAEVPVVEASPQQDGKRRRGCSGSDGDDGGLAANARGEPDARRPASSAAQHDNLRRHEERSDECGWLGRLPEPQHWGGTLSRHHHHTTTTHPCRFSALTAAQATHLAAPRTTRALATMRALHTAASGAAQLCWMYDAAPSFCGGVGEAAGSPPAVYWCLPSSSSSSSSSTTLLPGGDVLAWIAEDGSVVHVDLEGQGYTVRHVRVAAAVAQPTLYRLHAEGAATARQRLPPITAPLRCRVDQPPSGGSGDVRGCGAAGVSPSSTTVAVVDASSLVYLWEGVDGPERRSVAFLSACGVLTSLMELTTMSTVPSVRTVLCDPYGSHVAVAASSRMHDAPYQRSYLPPAVDVHALRCGRYLAAVVDVAVQLSQVNCAASRDERRAGAARPASPSPSLLQQRPINRNDAPTPWKDAARGSDAEGRVVAHEHAEAIVCLTSHLEGIGTFTALTNGAVRGHFADRVIVTLVPGANELDEAQLLATCVLRDARRCTVHVAQCRPGHPVFRYLAYMLPFRRFVYLQAGAPCEDDACHGLDRHSPRTHTERGEVSGVGGLSRVEDSAQLLPSLHSSAMDDEGAMVTAPPPPQLQQQQRTRWGIAEGPQIAQSLRQREAAAFAEHVSRLQEILDEQDSLSHATRALLRD